ncbi:MAG: protein TolR [Moraxellaceae bacterium]|nr:protein TolR [Moraxellaceae bacterium]MBS9779107.1 protein TolR [Moraxellaceae bacterium]
MKANPYSRQRNKLNSDMNVVPYIDVMLVLLVIFMVTAPMLTTGVEVDLPKHQSNNLAKSENLPVIVTFTANGELYLDYEGNPSKISVTEVKLIEDLSQLQAQRRAETKQPLQVMLNADQTNQYGKVVELMAKLQQAGIEKVGLLTDTPVTRKR